MNRVTMAECLLVPSALTGILEAYGWLIGKWMPAVTLTALGLGAACTALAGAAYLLDRR